MSALIEFHLVKAAGFMDLSREYMKNGKYHLATYAELKALQNWNQAIRLGVTTDQTWESNPFCNQGE